MRTIFEILQEAKDDNLHEFIQYIIDHGKQGELRSSHRDIYGDYMEYCDLEKAPEFSELTTAEHVLEWYCAENDIENSDEIKWTDDFTQNFIIWCIDKASDVILNFIDLNSKNCIYIERAIVVPTFANKDKLYKWFKMDYAGHLGVCWTYKENAGEAYYGGFEKGDTIILKGYVRPDDVDWTKTLALCLYNIDEYELRLNEDAPIQLTEIVTERGNHKIFTGNLILKA